jgi:DNA repair exonuclease SbcCD ATPase subunit
MTEDKSWMLTLGERKQGKELPFTSKENPMEQIKQGIEAVKETKKLADEVSGAEELKKKLEETKEELEKVKMETLNKELAEIKASLKVATENRDIPAIKELEQKLEEAREALYKEQVEALRREIAELRKAGGQNLAEEIKKVKVMAQELGLGSPVAETPPDILLQLKKMDQEIQLRLEEMRDERDRRDKEWQLTLKKWEEERALREQEIRQKYEVEKERIETLKSTFERGAKIIGRAITESEEGGKTGSIATAYHVEAAEGEMGEFACPKCSSPVAVAPDAVKAICANCGFSAQVRRTAKVEKQAA